MPKITYTTSKGQSGEVQGSDGRIDTSARVSSRLYYVSRDDGEAYTVISNDASAAAGTHIAYWQNTDSTGRVLVIESVSMSGVETALWKVHRVTGTAAAGSLITPSNCNATSSNASSSIARGDDSITGLSIASTYFTGRSAANGQPIVFDTKSSLIIGQNQAISVEYDTGTTGIAEVTIIGHFETPS